MNKDDKKGTATPPKRLTIQDLKNLLGGLGANVTPVFIEDNHGNKAHPLAA